MTRKHANCNRSAQPDKPTLRFSPNAWAKLLFFRDRGDVEIGGFGITDATDPLLIREFVTVKQTNSVVTVQFDDQAVASFFEDQVDLGRRPHQFGRLWLHTHPGDSAQPSLVDEETFERVFGSCDWAVMFIVSITGKTYARLRFNVGPGGSAELPVEVDYSREFHGSDHVAWAAEYDANVNEIKSLSTKATAPEPDDLLGGDDLFDDRDLDYLDDDPFFEFMESEVIHRW